jgi:hypothetical protein
MLGKLAVTQCLKLGRPVRLAETKRRAFLEICDERYLTKPTLLTSQLLVAKWHAQMGDPTVADSILDRLVHGAHRIESQGDSIRKLKGRNGKRTSRSGGVGCFGPLTRPIMAFGTIEQGWYARQEIQGQSSGAGGVLCGSDLLDSRRIE